jgi:hypothetical protein
MGIILFEDHDGDLYLLDEDRMTVHAIDGLLVEGGANFAGDAASIDSSEQRDYWDQFTIAFDEWDFVTAECIAVYDAGNVTVLAEPGQYGRDYLQLPERGLAAD